MSIKDHSKEELIRNTAKKIFFAEGRFKATTQEIADAAGVNRTLVHYYFRSRDLLFDQVLEEGRSEFRKKMSENVPADIPFRQKIEAMIDIWTEHALEYPYLDVYLVSTIHSREAEVKLDREMAAEKGGLDNFFEEIEKEMKKGVLVSMPPMHFVLNLLAMISYPLTMRPLMERAFRLTPKKYRQLLAERKEFILKSLFR
ncbi:MAG: TetR/AcrR family transcriptional regulator [Chitinophagaceae bacterium]|nr:MAG: TetR/AcrR family transcriptional regulator [Chitinophagaceae bacterium]